MSQPTTHTEQLIIIIDGKSHILTKTNKRGIECCNACSLDAVCNNGSIHLHLPAICCSMIEKGENFRFVEADKPQKN